MIRRDLEDLYPTELYLAQLARVARLSSDSRHEHHVGKYFDTKEQLQDTAYVRDVLY